MYVPKNLTDNEMEKVYRTGDVLAKEPGETLGDILTGKQIWNLTTADLTMKVDLREASDEDLRDCGLDSRDIKRVREYAKWPKEEKGDAVSLINVVLKRRTDKEPIYNSNGFPVYHFERLFVARGEIIREDWGAADRVQQGKAIWRKDYSYHSFKKMMPTGEILKRV